VPRNHNNNSFLKTTSEVINVILKKMKQHDFLNKTKSECIIANNKMNIQIWNALTVEKYLSGCSK
jgi:hypothetical protein